jgi:hypothetical protein
MMSLGTWGSRSSKYQRFLNISNVFLLITSTILIFCGIILISWYHMLKLHFWSPYFYWCPMLMLTLGIYTFGTTCYGFIISVKESRGLLTVMAILLSVAFIGQLASVFTAMMLRTDLETELANTAKIADDMDKYALEDSTKANWDSLQSSLRCCGGKRYEFGFRSWDRVPINGTKGHHVPDSCCHEQTEGCGRGKIDKAVQARSNNIGIWKDGCIEILEVMLKRDLIEYPFAWIYIGVGLILALVELITVVLACAYIAQINRRQRHQRMYTRAATADDDGTKYMPEANRNQSVASLGQYLSTEPGLHSSSHETNF